MKNKLKKGALSLTKTGVEMTEIISFDIMSNRIL